jgi:hypothetical protein
LNDQSAESSFKSLKEFGRLVQSGELGIILPHQPGKLRYACLFTRGLLLCAKKVKELF